MLICMGHHAAWDYGYDFFKTSLKMLGFMLKQQSIAIAMGIGLVLGGKKINYEKFLEDK